MCEKLFIFDTTLRDGEQVPGCQLNTTEKIEVAKLLESLGVDVIEAGFPISSPGDFNSVLEISKAVSAPTICALTRAVKKDIDVAADALRLARHKRIHTGIGVSPQHIYDKLRSTPEKILEQAVEAVKYAKSYVEDVEFYAEDAGRADPQYLARVVEAAIAAGATVVNIPDTTGYCLPHEYGAKIKYLVDHVSNIDKAIISTHCHNDLGMATANTLSGILNGARQAEVTINGIGERAGNASLEEIVMAMKVRPDVYGVDCGIQNEQLYPACRLLSLIIGRPIAATKAIVGSNAFAHESGIHQDGMLKNRETYEIMTPQSIGRKSTDLVIGKHSGRNAVRTRLEELGYRLDDEQVNVVFAAVKDLADKKANVHDEDLEALVFSEVYRLPDRYRLGNVSVQTTMGSSMPATAAVVIQAGEEEMRRAGFGAGPIDATFNVISQIVSRAPDLEQFSINAITGGTDAQGEVTVRLREGEYSATGRGSDPDIIVASAKAYIDALNRLDHKERDALRTQEATGEPAINTCN